MKPTSLNKKQTEKLLKHLKIKTSHLNYSTQATPKICHFNEAAKIKLTLYTKYSHHWTNSHDTAIEIYKCCTKFYLLNL